MKDSSREPVKDLSRDQELGLSRFLVEEWGNDRKD